MLRLVWVWMMFALLGFGDFGFLVGFRNFVSGVGWFLAEGGCVVTGCVSSAGDSCDF